MRMKPAVLLATLAIILATVNARASGPLGIYGIVEKVVFEPSEASPERIQVWGAFSFVEGTIPEGVYVISRSQRGYLYFTIPSGLSEMEGTTIRREWRDLRAIAGTGQAVGFGRWPGGARTEPPGAYLPALRAVEANFRVRPAEERAASPAPYMTNVGIVRISDQSANGWIVKQLREALKR